MANARSTKVARAKLIRTQRIALRATHETQGCGHYSDSESSDGDISDDDFDFAADEDLHQRMEATLEDDAHKNELDSVAAAMANLPTLQKGSRTPISRQASKGVSSSSRHVSRMSSRLRVLRVFAFSRLGVLASSRMSSRLRVMFRVMFRVFASN